MRQIQINEDIFYTNHHSVCNMIAYSAYFFLINVKTVYKLNSKSSRQDMCRLPTSFLLNIQSRVKQEVDMPQIQKCATRYSSPY